jgi:alpha-mannosidase
VPVGEVVPDAVAADVPPLGFAWQRANPAPRPPLPLAEGLTLRNEYFEIYVNRETGGIGSVHDYRHRRNRLSQQLAFRLPQSGSRAQPAQSPDAVEEAYTRMVADAAHISAANAVLGEITSIGRMIDARGREIARFRQVTQVRRGSRLIELAMEVSPSSPEYLPGEDAYFAVRIAWRDEPLEVRRGMNGASFLTDRNRIDAAQFVEILESDARLVVFSRGASQFVRSKENRLDALLPVQAGEEGRPFHMAIGVDVDGAASDWAVDWLLPPLLATASGTPAVSKAWWFLCGSQNVRWTSLGPLPDGRSGFTARLQELTGRYVKTKLEAFRPIRSARRTNFVGRPLIELPVHGGRIDLQMAGYQWIQLEAEWE